MRLRLIPEMSTLWSSCSDREQLGVCGEYNAISESDYCSLPTARTYGCRRATLEPMPQMRLLRVGAVDFSTGDLRAYATLFWVGKAAIIGYVTVSITQRGGYGGVRTCSA